MVESENPLPSASSAKVDEVKKELPEESKKASAASTRRLLKYLRQELGMFTAGALAMVGSNIGQLVIPLFVGKFINLITKGDFSETWTLAMQLLVLVAVSAPLP
jgi:hypothetical protein